MEKIEHPYAHHSAFSGVLDKNVKKLEQRLGVTLTVRGDNILIDGPEDKVTFAKHYFDQLRQLEGDGHPVKAEDFHIALAET